MEDRTDEYPPDLDINETLANSLQDLVSKEFIDRDEAKKKLGEVLQAALQLEFATIPPYLTAAFSLRGSKNSNVRELIMRVAKEEMLHMTVVANLMNAIGVVPDIKKAVPIYPCQLEVLKTKFPINLEPFSFELLKNTFMRIEAPEKPLAADAREGGHLPPKTIGQFYDRIIKIIEDSSFKFFEDVDESKQIRITRLKFKKVKYENDEEKKACRYPLKSDIDMVINNQETAVKHLKWIVSEGEGAADENSPIDPEGLPGHYYRFKSIIKGAYLIEQLGELSYNGGSLPFDEGAVEKFKKNAKAANSAGTVRDAMEEFNKQYTSMINLLDNAFRGFHGKSPQAWYGDALRPMRKIPKRAGTIIKKMKNVSDGGIPFEYTGQA